MYMNINDIIPKNINKIQGEKKSLTYENRTHNTSNKTDGKPLDSRTKAERWGIKNLNRKREKKILQNQFQAALRTFLH